MKSLEYIASGTAYLRLYAPRNREGANLEYLRKTLGQVSKQTNHKFGVLYNAYTESTFGPVLQHYKNDLDSIHADSGGLQIITQGLTADRAIRNKIYENQAKYASMSMSFDEIPLTMVGERSERNDTKSRFFDISIHEQKARKTGRNVKEQIEKFLELGSESKPIFIAQGNCLDTYRSWTEYALEEIPLELQKYIGGVAMGAPALGHGPLEDIQRAFFATQLPIDMDHLHILGVGAIRRVMPYLVMIGNGNYDGVAVSYDSTTHTSGVEMAQYFTKEGKVKKITKVRNHTFDEIYDDIMGKFDVSDMSVESFYRVMTNGYTKYVEQFGDDTPFLRFKTEYVMSSIINFCRIIDALSADKAALISKAAEFKLASPMNSFYDVKNLDDYEHWMKHVGCQIKSNRVPSSRPDSLEMFFV